MADARTTVAGKPKAKRGVKAKTKEKTRNRMFVELDRVMEQIARDKNIPKERLVEAVEQAFLSAARKKWGYLGELESHYDIEKGEIELFQFKAVMENVEDPNTQMTLEEGRELDPDAQVGDSLGVKMDPAVFGRVAAQTAKQVIIQKVREAERDIIYNEYKDRVGELVTGVIRRFEKGELVIDLGRAEAAIPRSEQVPSEQYKVGDRVQAYFLEINPNARGPMLILSRRHPVLVKKLFEMEAPEVADGTIEIRTVAREPGVRSKIAVESKDSDVDPVGACVGVKGSRVQSVVQELRGEKIDIVPWNEDPARFVCNAIQPAEVVKVIIKDREKVMEVVVPDDQLSLAIGRKGQNVRLAAQLSGWNIDVYSESRYDTLTNRYRRVLTEVFGVDDSTALILYAHGYRQFEDVARADAETFLKVPGVGEAGLRLIKEKADAVLREGFSTEKRIAEIAQAEEVELQKAAEAKKNELEALFSKPAAEETLAEEPSAGGEIAEGEGEAPAGENKENGKET